MRRLWVIALLIVGIMGVAGCTPPVVGEAGVSVDAEGHPLIILAWCGDSAPEGVSVSHYEDTSGPLGAVPGPSSDATTKSDVTFVAPSLEGQSASVRLDAPGDGWTVEPEPFVLRPGVLYNAFGHRGSGSGQVNIGSVSFSMESMAKLKPGLILVQRYDDTRSPAEWNDVVIPYEEFEREGQDPDRCR
ncbi:hypothetical protein ACFY19_18835 [Streptosporangium saharense]|uniref:hypothetical protein n=1 Tax=Streptosporangium saharense TaxID=1706840 RepID=UPI0036C4BD90